MRGSPFGADYSCPLDLFKTMRHGAFRVGSLAIGRPFHCNVTTLVTVFATATNATESTVDLSSEAGSGSGSGAEYRGVRSCWWDSAWVDSFLPESGTGWSGPSGRIGEVPGFEPAPLPARGGGTPRS